MPKIIESDTYIGSIAYEWDVREYDEHDRPRSWYIVMITLGIILVFFGIFSNNFLFSLIILLFAIILYIQAHQEPQEVPVALTDVGVVVGNRLYQYNEFANFFILFEPGTITSVFFVPKATLKPRIELDVGTLDVVEVRSFLTQFLTEDLDAEEIPVSEHFRRNWLLH
jgi:hypothetical protein